MGSTVDKRRIAPISMTFSDLEGQFSCLRTC